MLKPLCDDLTFKNVFRREDIFENFINSFLEYNNISLKYHVIYAYPEACLMPNQKKINMYYGDIVGILNNGDIISLELYSTPFNKRMYNKSYSYKSRLFADQIIKNNQYENMKRVISINLMFGNFQKINNKLVNKYTFKHQETNEIIEENTIMYLIRLDQIDKIEYVKGENKFLTYLRMINAKSIEEMEKYAKGDREMEEVIEYMRRWNKESAKNSLEKYVKTKEDAAEDKGQKKRDYEIVHNMKNQNFTIDIIKSITGLTEKEINDILKTN